MRQQYLDNEIVIGLLQLDNYMEYQSYENEEIMAQINTHLRASLVTWAKENKIEKADDTKDADQTDENVTVPVLGKINAKKV